MIRLRTSDKPVDALPLALPRGPRDSVRHPLTVATRLGEAKLRIGLLRWVDPLLGGLALGSTLLIYTNHLGAIKIANAPMGLHHLLMATAFGIWWTAVFAAADIYSPSRPLARELQRVAAASAVGVVYLMLLLPSATSSLTGAGGLIVFWTLATIYCSTARVLLQLPSSAAAKRVLLVGSGPQATRAVRQLRTLPQRGRKVVGFVDTTTNSRHDDSALPFLGTTEELEAVLTSDVIDEVLVALPVRSCYDEIKNVIRVCERLGIEIHYPIDLFCESSHTLHWEADPVGRHVTLSFAPHDLRIVVKRAVDIAGAFAGILLLVPLFVLIAIAIKVSGPGPVLFVQERVGLNRRRFRMYKFRTMVVNAEFLQLSIEHLNEATGPVFKMADDPRVTRLGRLLRRTSLDELPQLFNVLRGEMSLVGPRPLPERDVAGFREGRLIRRFSVPPGITCLWQISGRSRLGFDDWIRLDLQYIDEWSLALDLRILLRTIPAVIRGSGAV
jgi:exopolysaccharide biosynthesis polyprenyl glycosylphosphotransferase